MAIWLAILLGIILMQLSTLIVAIITNENEDTVIIYSIFLLYPIILLVRAIYKLKCKIKRKIKDKKQNQKGDK